METIILGDSLADPYGISPLPAWPDLLAQQEPAIGRVIVKNGFTTADLIECVSREVLALHPKKVLFICSTNDALRLATAERMLDSVIFLAREIEQSGAEPVWLIPPRIDVRQAAECYGDSPLQLNRADAALAELRRKVRADPLDWACIDLEEIRQGFLKQDKASYIDGIHFSPAFHFYLSEVLLPLISG